MIEPGSDWENSTGGKVRVANVVNGVVSYGRPGGIPTYLKGAAEFLKGYTRI